MLTFLHYILDVLTPPAVRTLTKACGSQYFIPMCTCIACYIVAAVFSDRVEANIAGGSFVLQQESLLDVVMIGAGFRFHAVGMAGDDRWALEPRLKQVTCPYNKKLHASHGPLHWNCLSTSAFIPKASAAHLGIPDLLKDGPKSAAEIAQELGKAPANSAVCCSSHGIRYMPNPGERFGC